MRSIMLALGACLFALNFAGCSSTGSCGGNCGGQPLLGGGNIVGNLGCSGCGESSGGCSDTGCSNSCGDSSCSSGSCGGRRILGGGNVAGNLGRCGCSDTGNSNSCANSSCSGGCGNSGCATAFANKNYGGSTGLGLSLMETGPSCEAAGCNGGCQSCQRQRLQLPKLQRPNLASRLAGRLSSIGCGCGGGSDSGCGASESAPAGDCGCDTPAPALPETDCGCSASTSAGFSISDIDEGTYEEEGEVQLASHIDRRGLLAGLGLGRKHKLQGCGAPGCGGRGGLCSNCLSRLHGAGGGLGAGRGLGAGGGLGVGGGLGLGAGGGTIPHRDPTIHGGGGAGPAGQIPTYAYPYYTTRAPRDFLAPNPPTIGF